MRLRKTLVGAVLAFIASGSAWSATANSLVSTTPISGATLTSSPSVITMTTEAPLIDLGNTITVRDPQGARVDDGTLTINGTNAVAGLKLLTVSGIYTVSYSLLTDNDIPLEGTYTFTFDAPSVISSPSPTTISPSVDPGNSPNNSVGIPTLVVALILSAVAVFLFLCFYAWKLITKR